LDTINEQAQHAANLIRQILDFSRRSVLEKTPLDLMPLVKEIVKLLERILPESIRLELTYDRSEYIVNGDPTRLQQALMNLAFNARDAMPNGGQLTFTCATLSLASEQTPPLPDMSAGEWFCLSVTDTGTGIAPEHLAHIFEPFFTTKEPGKGSGLGLAQVYGIVKQHDGAIDVHTQEGKGSMFTLYLPARAEPALAAPVPQSGLIQGHGETILVVEDNPVMRMALVDILELMNYQVWQAANGREALAVLQEKAEQIDLVLSDLVMPEMGGQALLDAMRERGLGMPLVVLSGHPLTNEMEAMQVQGLAGWLLKPPDMHELSALLARILGQPTG
jgi:two-component system cell cycle sensor histidine kinase/response regulator CckA